MEPSLLHPGPPWGGDDIGPAASPAVQKANGHGRPFPNHGHSDAPFHIFPLSVTSHSICTLKMSHLHVCTFVLSVNTCNTAHLERMKVGRNGVKMEQFLQENSTLEKGISLAGNTSGRGCLTQEATGTDLPQAADEKERQRERDTLQIKARFRISGRGVRDAFFVVVWVLFLVLFGFVFAFFQP